MGLIDSIIKANKNLTESNKNNNWEMMGKDINKLQTLITKLEEVKEIEDKKRETLEKEIKNKIDNEKSIEKTENKKDDRETEEKHEQELQFQKEKEELLRQLEAEKSKSWWDKLRGK